MRKFNFIIEITSDWALVKFIGTPLSEVKVTKVDGTARKINIRNNEIYLMGNEEFSRIEFSSVIDENIRIEKIRIEKGDKGKVDVEIEGRHFVNFENVLNNPINPKEIELDFEIISTSQEIYPKEIFTEKESVVRPKVLIVTPIKNDACYLERHFSAWENVDYPREEIRWVWIYGHSKDNTKEMLDKYFSNGEWNCEIYYEPKFKNLTCSAMWIADVMNAARKLYRGEDYVLIEDGDIVKIAPDLLNELIRLDLDIVAPYVWHDGREKDFFDTYVFRDLYGVKYPINNVPFTGHTEPIEMNSVGTMVLIKGKIFSEIEFENPCPNLQFCNNAKRKGYRIWTAPWINIFHADVGKERGESHMSPEFYIEKGILPKSLLEKVK